MNDLSDCIRLAEIEWSYVEIKVEHYGTLNTITFQVSPSRFLELAYTDFRLGTEDGLINSLTNAKRAIDCQIDTY
ncbi:hypothetical protein V3851_08630 [Paenibacillus sp. M1]|uniref:KTSC domain-containing protein n=1 Tax=Paenibacillus haidiansis TaxID=1574488 RepID=A0ABU7VQ85_9BACL